MARSERAAVCGTNPRNQALRSYPMRPMVRKTREAQLEASCAPKALEEGQTQCDQI